MCLHIVSQLDLDVGVEHLRFFSCGSRLFDIGEPKLVHVEIVVGHKKNRQKAKRARHALMTDACAFFALNRQIGLSRGICGTCAVTSCAANCATLLQKARRPL